MDDASACRLILASTLCCTIGYCSTCSGRKSPPWKSHPTVLTWRTSSLVNSFYANVDLKMIAVIVTWVIAEKKARDRRRARRRGHGGGGPGGDGGGGGD